MSALKVELSYEKALENCFNQFLEKTSEKRMIENNDENFFNNENILFKSLISNSIPLNEADNYIFQILQLNNYNITNNITNNTRISFDSHDYYNICVIFSDLGIKYRDSFPI